MPPCDKVILSLFWIWAFILENIFANDGTCTLVLNEEGDSKQIEMKSNNFTGLSNKGTIVSLSRETCVNNSTIQLTILPEDIKALTFPERTQAKLTLYIRYTLAFLRNSSRLQTLQRSVMLTRSRKFKQLTCWLPISVPDHLHTINVTVAGDEYNTIATSTLDVVDQAINCKEGCKSDDIMFNTSYLCLKNGTFNHKPSARVLRVSFEPLGKGQKVKGQTTLKHWSVTNSSISFQCNDKCNGIGRLEVSYRQLNADLYCYVYSDIRIVCDHVTSKFDRYDDTESFGTFVVFGLIVMTCFTAILALIIFVVQKLMGFHRAYKNRRESTPKERRRRSSLLGHLKTDEIIRNSILNMHKIVSEPEAQPLRAHGNGTSSERETSFLRNSSHKSSHNRIASCSSWASSILSQTNSGLPSKTSSGKKLQRSVTQAMLEDLDESKCSIIFLTLPFDQYTRDVTELLRNVLSIEGGIPSQCCFDPDVLSDYQTNRFAFLEEITGNTNKILVFVFLTTLSYGTKEEKLIHDLLNHCLLKQRIIPQCKVVFLHLTDDDSRLETRYHGQHIHLKHDNAYKKFLSVILRECGINVDERNVDSELHKRMLSCSATKHLYQLLSYNGDKAA
ncbi:uncharacterized protein LOC128241587 isoform X1 [Mya arenaria]|uniref:uncharacterized protein LOC128241587 isoform X1 n=1 Tax=Mya arenaria TaxID=6604 RepID=UPI0022DFBB3D|nr:uncharacterized protein LOC128241587 isoform X1 [Mya arenaria]